MFKSILALAVINRIFNFFFFIDNDKTSSIISSGLSTDAAISLILRSIILISASISFNWNIRRSFSFFNSSLKIFEIDKWKPSTSFSLSMLTVGKKSTTLLKYLFGIGFVSEIFSSILNNLLSREYFCLRYLSFSMAKLRLFSSRIAFMLAAKRSRSFFIVSILLSITFKSCFACLYSFKVTFLTKPCLNAISIFFLFTSFSDFFFQFLQLSYNSRRT